MYWGVNRSESHIAVTCGSSGKHQVAVGTGQTGPSDGWGCGQRHGSSCRWRGGRKCSAWCHQPWQPWEKMSTLLWRCTGNKNRGGILFFSETKYIIIAFLKKKRNCWWSSNTQQRQQIPSCCSPWCWALSLEAIGQHLESRIQHWLPSPLDNTLQPEHALPSSHFLRYSVGLRPNMNYFQQSI